MASRAEWVATSLGKHHGVESARLVSEDCVEVHRRGAKPTVTVRVVDYCVDPAALEKLDLEDVDAVVCFAKPVTYTWEAKLSARDRNNDLYTNSEFWTALNKKEFIGSEASDIQYFVDRIGTHGKVRELERLKPRSFRVHRRSTLEPLQVYCADEYILSEDFVQQVLESHPETQIITNLSGWNKITPEAVGEARRRGCRVFNLSDMYAALHQDAAKIFAD